VLGVLRQQLSEFSIPAIRTAGSTVDHQRLYRQSLNHDGGVNTPHPGHGNWIVSAIPLCCIEETAGFCVWPKYSYVLSIPMF
jgi:hypothetical protein